ncbi:hypothetical protein GCM10027174_00680 [Salinifilum aidingensis]
MTSTPSTSSPAPDRSLHLQCACTLLVAVGAAYVSYRHGREFALRFGADETTATLWPLIVDGLLTTATIELWKAGHPTAPPGGGKHGCRSPSASGCRCAPTSPPHPS